MFLKKRKGIIIIISLLGLVLLCMFVLMCFGVLMLHRNLHHECSERLGYQFYQENSHTNTTSFGLVSLSPSQHDSILSNEFISYQKENSYFLISRLGDEEYRCIGSCFCDDDSDNTDSSTRRFGSSSTSTTIKRGLTFLVATISSAIAYTKAKEYFDNQCITKLSSSCNNPTSIHSEVESCEKIKPSLSSSEETEETEQTTTSPPTEEEEEKTVVGEEEEKVVEKEEKKVKREKDIRKFFCEGSCLARRVFEKKKHNVKDRFFDMIEKADSYGCQKLSNDGEVEIDCGEYEGDLDLCKIYAGIEFAGIHLKKFCHENSKVEYYYKAPPKMHDKFDKDGFAQWKNLAVNKKFFLVSVCVGIRRIVNPTVRCRSI